MTKTNELSEKKGLDAPLVSERSLFALRQRAEKASYLMDKMDETFPSYPKENRIMVIMACINDAYRVGVTDCMNAR